MRQDVQEHWKAISTIPQKGLRSFTENLVGRVMLNSHHKKSLSKIKICLSKEPYDPFFIDMVGGKVFYSTISASPLNWAQKGRFLKNLD